MKVDAPTTAKLSLLVGLQVVLTEGWSIRVEDVRAAFLNGVKAPRELYEVFQAFR